MRRLVPILIIGLAGCSTAPLAGTMDCLLPSRSRLTDPPDRGEPRGDIRLPDPPRDSRPAVPRNDEPFLRPPQLDR